MRVTMPNLIVLQR